VEQALLFCPVHFLGNGSDRQSSSLRKQLERETLDQAQRVQHELERQLGRRDDSIFS